MSTEVKIVRESGIDGRILHRHGDSAWHPSHREHSGARGPQADAHTVNDAANPTNAKDVLKNADLRKAYADSLKGVEQPAFAAKWEQRKAAMRGKAKAVVSKAEAIAAELDAMEDAMRDSGANVEVEQPID